MFFVNKLLAHVSWKSFSFHFIKKKKKKPSNISGIRVVIIYKNKYEWKNLKIYVFI